MWRNIVNTFDIGILLLTWLHGEGISNTIIEYMASEKNSNRNKLVEVHNEIINNNETGYLVEPENSIDLADKILFLT